MSNKEETFIVYYALRQIKKVDGVSYVNLHSDRERRNVIGRALYVTNSLQDFGLGRAWSVQTATWFFGEDAKDVLMFQDNSATKDGVLPEGKTLYQILGGQGKYLGATGTIEFDVNRAGLRTMTVRVKLA